MLLFHVTCQRFPLMLMHFSSFGLALAPFCSPFLALSFSLEPMVLLDSFITGIADFLIHRLLEASFSIAHAFTDIVDGPIAGPTAVTDCETSPDSDAPQFLSGEEFITASLLRFRSSTLAAGPQLTPHLRVLRYRARVFLYGSTLSVSTLATLASVSRPWLLALANFTRDQFLVCFEDVESVSERWELPYRVLLSTPTEYLARFTGRVVQHLGRRRVTPPVPMIALQLPGPLCLHLYSF